MRHWHQRIGMVASLAALALACSAGLSAGAGTPQQRTAGAATTKPAREPRASSPRALRLWGEWAKMTTLSESQKAQIAQRHRKFLAEQRELEDRQEADILALLTEAQKAERRDILEQQAAERKLKEAQRKAQALLRQAEQAPLAPPATPAKPEAQRPTTAPAPTGPKP